MERPSRIIVVFFDALWCSAALCLLWAGWAGSKTYFEHENGAVHLVIAQILSAISTCSGVSTLHISLQVHSTVEQRRKLLLDILLLKPISLHYFLFVNVSKFCKFIHDIYTYTFTYITSNNLPSIQLIQSPAPLSIPTHLQKKKKKNTMECHFKVS